MKLLVVLLIAVALSCSDALPGRVKRSEEQDEAEDAVPTVECPEQEEDELVLIPDADDDAAYYECRDGEPSKVRCPDNSRFDAEAMACKQIFAPVGECPLVDGELPTFLADANNKSTYHQCRAGQAIPMGCPAGLEFNLRLNVCDWPQDPSTPYAKPNGECPLEDGATPTILGDSYNCVNYYVCYAGKPFPAACPSGLQFNQEMGYCDFPHNVVCNQDN